MKTTLFIATTLIAHLTFAQKTVTTFYDWQKTKKEEVYQTDANGVKNGSYKYYNESGFLLKSAAFKNGHLEGVLTEYTKFPNYSGTLQIKKTETYSNDVLNGLATYYLYDENLGVYEFQKGNYKNGAEDGTWIKISPFNRILEATDIDYIKSLPLFKGYMAIKETITYQNGEKLITDGKHQEYYYPSNKIYHSFTLNNGKYKDDDSYFYPDGKLWSIKTFDGNSNYISLESYYYNGKLKLKEVMNPYSYEGYNLDGTPDRATIETINRNKREEEKKSKRTLIDSAEMALNADNIDEAIKFYEKANGNAPQYLTGFNELLDKYKKKEIDKESLFNSYSFLVDNCPTPVMCNYTDRIMSKIKSQ